MDLSADHLHRQLDLIADQGWEGPAAAELLSDVLRHVVRPVVRAARLRGPAAEQAEATGWAAAWDALRRPTARSAENPGGMLWLAVRRSVAGEVRQGLAVGVPVGDVLDIDGGPGRRGAAGPMEQFGDAVAVPLGGRVGWVVDVLVDVGWERHVVQEVIGAISEWQGTSRGPAEVGAQAPVWQLRRVARLVRHRGSPPSLLELAVRHGRPAVEHPAAVWAARSTLSRWQAGPSASLEQLAAALRAQGDDKPPAISPAPVARGQLPTGPGPSATTAGPPSRGLRMVAQSRASAQAMGGFS